MLQLTEYDYKIIVIGGITCITYVSLKSAGSNCLMKSL